MPLSFFTSAACAVCREERIFIDVDSVGNAVVGNVRDASLAAAEPEPFDAMNVAFDGAEEEPVGV